mgnify:CR=1 FL=1
MMTHVEKTLIDTVRVLKQLRDEQNIPLHALIYGKWGAGKTVSAKKIAKSVQETFYIKIESGITRSRLLKKIGFSLGCGARHSYESSLDLIRAHIEYTSLRPIIIVDEAQRIMANREILDELKDLAEDDSLRFSYIFLGDHTTPKIIASHPHSIHSRIVIRKELSPLSLNTVEKLLQENKLKTDAEKLYVFAKGRGWTTLDLTLAIQALKNTQSQSEINEETLSKVANALGR